MEDMRELADLQDSLLDAAALYGFLHFWNNWMSEYRKVFERNEKAPKEFSLLQFTIIFIDVIRVALDSLRRCFHFLSDW